VEDFHGVGDREQRAFAAAGANGDWHFLLPVAATFRGYRLRLPGIIIKESRYSL